MARAAVMWIRDGVLIDRMHINPVAFAFAYWVYTAPDRRSNTDLESLINFGFEKSGLSCADKMELFNKEKQDLLKAVFEAAGYYNVLASEAAEASTCFPGAVELLRDLQNAGVHNFITSAVEQYVLDAWGASQQGSQLKPYFTEILGRRYNLAKGRDHFDHVSRLGYDTIYYVADAPAEIESAARYAATFHLIPLGFGNPITASRVKEALNLVKESYFRLGSNKVPYPIEEDAATIDISRLKLADTFQVAAALYKVGAEEVITGTAEEIMKNLRSCFEKRSLL